MSNPYRKGSTNNKAYDALKKAGAPVSVTMLSKLIGVTYSALYSAVDNDSVGAIEFKTVDGQRCVALTGPDLNPDSVESIIENMQGAEPMCIKDIAIESGVSEATAKAFIAEQNKMGNIEITPARNQADYKYEWVGPIRIGAAPSSETKADDEMIARLEQALDGEPKPVVEAEADVAPIETHETPAPKGIAGNGKAVESVYMVVVNGETRLCKTESEAYEIGSREAGKQAAVFVYEVVSVSQIKYTPTVVEHDLASLCQ